MSHDTAVQPANPPDVMTSAAGGNVLPDLEYVGHLFAALDALHLGAGMSAANEVLVAADVDADAIDDAVTHEECDAMATEPDNLPLTLPAQCLLRDAVEIKTTLMECAERDALHVDIGAVERVDAAFMQVLLSLAIQRKSSGKSALHFIGVSAALSEAAQVLGLIPYMQLADVAG